MKFKVIMKSPDSLNRALRQATDDLSEDVKEALGEVEELCARWFKWSEYLCVEVDTDAETCIVVAADGKEANDPLTRIKAVIAAAVVESQKAVTATEDGDGGPFVTKVFAGAFEEICAILNPA